VLAMRWIVIAGVIIVVAVGYVALGYADPEVERRCPSCGTRSLVILYQGYTGGATRFRCATCSAEFHQSGDGSLVK
jgi:DNA-directed RNA polymerase subunit RPC12/RpoP